MGAIKNLWIDFSQDVLENRSVAECDTSYLISKTLNTRTVFLLVKKDLKEFDKIVWQILDENE